MQKKIYSGRIEDVSVAMIRPTKEEIMEAEALLGFPFPPALKAFYIKYGYGPLPANGSGNINLVMHPVTAANFREKAGERGGALDLSLHEEYIRKYLVFFAVNESAYIAVPIDPGEHGVYFEEKKIADSIPEFVYRMIRDDSYFLSG